MFSPDAYSRRSFLRSSGCGFGALAASSLAASDRSSHHAFHHAPTAKRVIFLFMAGGVSQVDSFDYKPTLDLFDGKEHDFADARSIAKTGKGISARVMKSLWPFSQKGDCGKWTSDLFPEISRHVDDLCFLHGMHTEGVAHGPATLFLHTGTTTQIRPSMGSWISYGLGTLNENLPTFVTLSPSSGNGGPRNYGSSFLPAVHQGTAIGRAGLATRDATIRFIENTDRNRKEQHAQLELIQSLNRDQIDFRQQNGMAVPSDFEAILESYEMAWRMQHFAPDVIDISSESSETKAMYGIDEKRTDDYGRQCLMARRLAEAGVRFIQVNYTDNSNNPAWDQHSNLPKHKDHARAVDLPISGLLSDLKQRGLLEDTLVWWGGEFGRNPFAQNNGTGRDHDPNGFTVWLAGGGVKQACAYGQTDEFGHRAITEKTHMHDLHATVLHLLGLDHQRLTYRFAGRDFRLTDVAGEVIHQIIT